MVLNHQSTSRSSVFHFYDVTLYSEVLLLKFSRFINVTDLLYSWIFKLLFRVSLKKEITSRIHRITQPLQLERISGYPLVQPHYSKEGHPLKQIAKDHGQPGFEYLHSWRIHNLSRNLFQGLTILMVKKIFLIFKLYFFYFSLCPLPLAVHWEPWEESGSTSFTLSRLLVYKQKPFLLLTWFHSRWV